MFWNLIWILFVVSLLLSVMGFYKFVYFLSIGYGLAVMGEGAAIAIMNLTSGHTSIAILIQCVLMMVYGFRLSGFLLMREFKNASFRKSSVYDNTLNKSQETMPIFVKATIWIFCAVLYVMQVSPVFFRAMNEQTASSGSVIQWIGIVIMIVGIILEAVADKQKSAQKKVNPNMVATKGLFTLCRCPNYFGEILFWTGILFSGLDNLQGIQWVIAIIGYICIVFIMFNGAQRLEKRQNRNYGSKKEYQEYVSKTPILIPGLPIYHLVKETKK